MPRARRRRRVLEHLPAEDVSRPTVAPESLALGLTHLRLEALLTARVSADADRAG